MRFWSIYPNITTKIFISEKLLNNLNKLWKKVGREDMDLEHMTSQEAMKLCKTLLMLNDLMPSGKFSEEYTNEELNHYLLKLWKIIATDNVNIRDYSLNIGKMRKNNELVLRKNVDEMIFDKHDRSKAIVDFSTEMIRFVKNIYQINTIDITIADIEKVLSNFNNIYYKLFGDEGDPDEVLKAMQELKQEILNSKYNENTNFKIKDE